MPFSITIKYKNKLNYSFVRGVIAETANRIKFIYLTHLFLIENLFCQTHAVK